MGLGQTIIYIVVPVVVVIYLLISDTTGLNFSLKVNFIANFMAPLLAYTAISTLGLAYTFTDTKNTMLEFGLIGALTFLITYVVAVISMYKAAKDKTKDGIGASKVSCKNYKMSSALKHGLKISIIGIITFLLVSLYPVLQKPFSNLSSKMGVEDPEKMAYGIVGFYMAFMSLSGTAMSYFPALEEGCTMTDEEITDAFNKGYPTLNYMKYTNKNKELEDKVYKPKDEIKGFYFDEKTGQFELKAGKSTGTKGKASAALSYKQGDTLEAIKLIKGENGKTIKTGKRFFIDTIGGTGTFITVKTVGVAGTTPITITIDKTNINASNAKVIPKAQSTTGTSGSATSATSATSGGAAAKGAATKGAAAKGAAAKGAATKGAAAKGGAGGAKGGATKGAAAKGGAASSKLWRGKSDTYCGADDFTIRSKISTGWKLNRTLNQTENDICWLTDDNKSGYYYKFVDKQWVFMEDKTVTQKIKDTFMDIKENLKRYGAPPCGDDALTESLSYLKDSNKVGTLQNNKQFCSIVNNNKKWRKVWKGGSNTNCGSGAKLDNPNDNTWNNAWLLNTTKGQIDDDICWLTDDDKSGNYFYVKKKKDKNDKDKLVWAQLTIGDSRRDKDGRTYYAKKFKNVETNL